MEIQSDFKFPKDKQEAKEEKAIGQNTPNFQPKTSNTANTKLNNNGDLLVLVLVSALIIWFSLSLSEKIYTLPPFLDVLKFYYQLSLSLFRISHQAGHSMHPFLHPWKILSHIFFLLHFLLPRIPQSEQILYVSSFVFTYFFWVGSFFDFSPLNF